MDQQELFLTFLGSFLTAFLAALAILAVEKWWTYRSDFLNSIKGLETEIQNNIDRLEQLKEVINSNLAEFEERKIIGEVMDIPPVSLLHDSFDYCRFKGYLSKLSEKQLNDVNYLYAMSDIITTIVDRDFQITIFERGEALFINKKRLWIALLALIKSYKDYRREVKF